VVRALLIAIVFAFVGSWLVAERDRSARTITGIVDGVEGRRFTVGAFEFHVDDATVVESTAPGGVRSLTRGQQVTVTLQCDPACRTRRIVIR